MTNLKCLCNSCYKKGMKRFCLGKCDSKCTNCETPTMDCCEYPYNEYLREKGELPYDE